MDIDRALRNMDSSSRDLVRKNVEAYLRTKDVKFAREAIAILENFDDDLEVRELIRSLKR